MPRHNVKLLFGFVALFVMESFSRSSYSYDRSLSYVDSPRRIALEDMSILIERILTDRWVGFPIYSGGRVACNDIIMKKLKDKNILKELFSMPGKLYSSELPVSSGEDIYVSSPKKPCIPIYSQSDLKGNLRRILYPMVENCNILYDILNDAYLNNNFEKYILKNYAVAKFNLNKYPHRGRWRFERNLSDMDKIDYSSEFLAKTKENIKGVFVHYPKEINGYCSISISHKTT